MPGGWQGSTRRYRLPANWRQLRQQVLERDGYQCTWVEHGRRCPNPADAVDHIVPGDDHGMHNLRAICTPHHNTKSAAEGGSSPRRATERRPRERHPGLLPPGGAAAPSEDAAAGTSAGTSGGSEPLTSTNVPPPGTSTRRRKIIALDLDRGGRNVHGG